MKKKRNLYANIDVHFDDATRSHHYVGFISKFDTMKGYGFVSCLETFKRFGRDIFIDRESYQAASPRSGQDLSSSKHFQQELVGGLFIVVWPQALGPNCSLLHIPSHL